MARIPLEILSLHGDGYHLLVSVELFDHTFKMVVDTGASKTVFDRYTLINSGVLESDLLNTNIMSSGLGTTSMESFTTRIPHFKIGDWELRKFTGAVLDLSTINYAYDQMGLPAVVGVLGGDILHTYGAVIDYKTSTLKLNKRKRPNKSK